ncbi:pyridoxine 5'-phosphate oxidase C-terminal domain-containing protein [Streptomyces sp. NPDC020362]|uniref:pyridoxine 5'-phosphate oxidase C-terminal domain-containing protein n=1 Tax=unclassified Streptomyces TaxID=2593676 RepID=UPI0033E790B1
MDKKPSPVDSVWPLYALAPTKVEIWQAAKSRLHTRLRYERVGDNSQHFQFWSSHPRAPHSDQHNL